MDDRPPEQRFAREERVRDLGFNPAYLTPQEQMDLLELHASAPEPAPPYDRREVALPRRS